MSSNIKNWKDGPFLLLSLAIILIALFYSAWDGLVEMERIWGSKEEYGYAYIIPFITLFFIWQKRYLILDEPFRFSAFGFSFALFGLFILTMGILSATFSIIQYAFIFTFVSSIWMLLGWRACKPILGPLALLFLMVPLPPFLFNTLSGHLQLISSEIGVWVIRQFGISVYLEGNIIDLGVYQLQVVEACSGLRYLFPLFSLSMIAAFIYKAAFWKKIVIVLSSIPITIIMNSFRIGVIGVLVEYGGIEQAEGFLHDFEGWVVFMACMALLLLEMWLLLKVGPEKTTLANAFTIDEVEVPDDPYKNNIGTIGTPQITAAICITALAFSINLLENKEQVIPERESFAYFPLEIGAWQGISTSLEPHILDALKLDDYFMADYKNKSMDSINFYMAYYASQQAGEAAHSPKSCIPGGGWKIKSHTVIDVQGAGIPVNRLVIKKGDYGQLVYYWFDQRSRTITNEYKVKWYLFWDSLTRGRTDGALVRLTTTLEPGDDLAKADERLAEFARLINPSLVQYIPE